MERWEAGGHCASVGPGNPHPDTSFKGSALCHHLGQLPSGGVADVSPPQGGREEGAG